MIFEESGHFPHTEEPEHFVEVVAEFVDTTEPMHLDEAEWRGGLVREVRSTSPETS